MAAETLAQALEREHHEIDAGIEAFTRDPGREIASLKRALQALRRHIYLEEEFIFPTLRRSHLIAPILAMVREHAEIWATMERIEDTEFDAQDESGHEEFLTLIHGLLEQLERHNFKEEPVIYPGIAKHLSPEDIAKVEVLMVEGNLPVGWVCQGARVKVLPNQGQHDIRNDKTARK